VDGEGFAVFTALQRQGVPSRLVYFENENHWVLNPANSLKWHREGKAIIMILGDRQIKVKTLQLTPFDLRIVIGWLDRYTKNHQEE
jgi:hypothetical protein